MTDIVFIPPFQEAERQESLFAAQQTVEPLELPTNLYCDLRFDANGYYFLIRWVDADDSRVIAYKLSYAEDGNTIPIGFAGVGKGEFKHRASVAGPYQFHIASIGEGDRVSGESISYRITIPQPPVPQNLSVTLPDKYTVIRDVSVVWASGDREIPLIGYEVQRRGVQDAEWQTISTPASNILSYSDKTPADGTYAYRVRSIDISNNKSAFSGQAIVEVTAGVVTDTNVIGADSASVSTKDFAVPALDLVDDLNGDILSGVKIGNDIFAEEDGQDFSLSFTNSTVVGDIPPNTWNLRTDSAETSPIVSVDTWTDFIGRYIRVNRSSVSSNTLVANLTGQTVTLTIGEATAVVLIDSAHLLDTTDNLSDINIFIGNILSSNGEPTQGTLVISDILSYSDIAYRANVIIPDNGVGKHYYVETQHNSETYSIDRENVKLELNNSNPGQNTRFFDDNDDHFTWRDADGATDANTRDFALNPVKPGTSDRYTFSERDTTTAPFLKTFTPRRAGLFNVIVRVIGTGMERPNITGLTFKCYATARVERFRATTSSQGNQLTFNTPFEIVPYISVTPSVSTNAWAGATLTSVTAFTSNSTTCDIIATGY